MTNLEIARLLLSVGAVELRPRGPFFTFASGIQSPIYTDNRLLLSNVEARDAICEAFVARVQQLVPQPDVIAGTATAGIPHATLLAHRLRLPLVYVRGESKGHGRSKRIEGHLPAGARVVLIEDLISTGGSAISAAQALGEADAAVSEVLAIFDYGFETARRRFDEAGLCWSALSSFDALLDQAVESGQLNAEQQSLLRRWSRDPETWPSGQGAADAREPVDELVVAADLEDAAGVESLGRAIAGEAGFIKLNSAFVQHGPDLIRRLRRLGLKIFLDLKFHDIPNTAANHVRAAADLGVDLVTVHASGGGAMLRACARAARARGATRPRVLAVTALTSLDDAALHETGVAGDRQAQVMRLARLARASGLDGIVCSVAEAPSVRAECGADFLIVTPGVRPASSSKDDHAAAMTPAEARASGADYVVVGRPIYEAADPTTAARAVAEELRRRAL
jgi:orotidine 5'-phosphate decarboxylase subfamily 1/orotate phosphoribosyltransferase